MIIQSITLCDVLLFKYWIALSIVKYSEYIRLYKLWLVGLLVYSISILDEMYFIASLLWDEEIEDNPMKEIFQKCFTEEDRKTLLAYIGCCLYDHGYTQRQESLFIMT